MGKILYKRGTPAEKSYLLRSGEMKYHITDSDSIVVNAENVIIGASEILMAISKKTSIERYTTLEMFDNAKANVVEANKLASYISNYPVGIAVAHHIASNITKLHPILSSKMNMLHKNEKRQRSITSTYVEIVELLVDEAKNRQFPWLFSLIENGKHSNSYNFGLSLKIEGQENMIDPNATHFAQYKRVYPKDVLICREGEDSDEMYILMKGKIEVIIKNNPIDIISKKGSTIGEMGLILGQTRSATLKALEEVQVVNIGAKDMEKVFKNDPDSFFEMLSSLAFREHENCKKIYDYDVMIKSGDSSGVNDSLIADYASELAHLLSELDRATEEHPEYEWLMQIMNFSKRKINDALADLPGYSGVSETKVESSGRVVRPVKDNSMPKIDWF